MGNWRNRPFNLLCLDRNARERRSKQARPTIIMEQRFLHLRNDPLKPTKTCLVSNHTAEGQQAAASQPAESPWQLSSLVLISNAARAEKIVAKRPVWPHQEYTSTFACIVSDPHQDLEAVQSSDFQLQNGEKEHSSCSISLYPIWNWSMENFAAACQRLWRNNMQKQQVWQGLI